MKPLTKTMSKKQTKNSVKKKPIVKKVMKKVSKPEVKKLAAKPKPALSKKISEPAKPAKKVADKKIVSKSPKEVQKEVKKPMKVVKEKKPVKPVKSSARAAEPEKPAFVLGEKKKYKRRKGGRKKKNKGDDEEPEILHDELVEQLIRSTKKLRSQPKKPRILKTFVNPMTSLSVAPVENANKKAAPVSKKEPKGKYTLEYVMNTTVAILFEFLSSPSGLVEWFADEASIYEGVYTFVWDGSAQKAKITGVKENEFIRLQWLEKTDGTYFEFRIMVDAIAKDVSLIITDFLDDDSDLDTSKRLWDSQIEKLLHAIATY